MIVDSFFDFIFNIVTYVLGFVPSPRTLDIISACYTLCGYGIYLLGAGFFQTFITTCSVQVTGITTWFFLNWIFNKIRGSGN